MNIKITGLLVLIFIIFSISNAQSGLKTTIDNLALFQGGDGGFVDEQLEPSSQLAAKGNLEETSLGVFLGSLFYQTDKFSVPGVGEFLKDLTREDGGFSKTSQDNSDLTSTATVLTIFNNLGAKVPNPQDVLAFVRSLYDENTGLYSNVAGSPGSIVGTAAALQIFTFLGTNTAPYVANNFPRINEVLKSAIISKGGVSYFSFANEGLSKIRAAYLAAVITGITNFQPDEPEKIVGFLSKLQRAHGGFAINNERNYRDTYEAAYAVAVFSSKFEKQIDEVIDINLLEDFIDSARPQLTKVGYAQKAAIISGIIKRYFNAKLILENEDGSEIKSGMVQGTKFKPTIRVKGFEGVASPRFVVQTIVRFGELSENYNLIYSKQLSKHVATDFFNTGDKKGQVTISAAVRLIFPGTGVVVLDFEESRTVGYNIEVSARANLEATGKDIAVGESISTGTEFVFDLQFVNAKGEKFTSGNFDVILSVIDASGVVFDQQKQNAKENTDGPVTFSYTLEKKNIPTGEIAFRFEVSEAEIGVHSRTEVTYELSGTLIASAIKFNGELTKEPVFKLGDKVQVTIVPAAFPDLRSVLPFDKKDIDGKDVSRKFLLDIVSPSGIVLQTIKGVPVEKESGVYQFNISLKPSLDILGTNVLSFRYETQSGASIELQPYDSEFGELFEDASQVKFSVPSDLRIADVKEQPSGDDFFYGNNIAFKFKVKDTKSGHFLVAGTKGTNVLLSLQHVDESGNSFASETKAATQPGDYFEIDWNITPNAIKGAATIIIFAENAAKQKFDILTEDGKAVSYKVNIGGEIDVESDTYTSTSPTDEKTTVIASFSLTCQNNALLGARLSASLETYSGTVVASNLPISSQKDQYQVSISLPHDRFPENTYVLKFYRNTDLARLETDDAKKPDPLFDVAFIHPGTGRDSLPISPQFVIFVSLVAAFVAIFLKRSEIITER